MAYARISTLKQLHEALRRLEYQLGQYPSRKIRYGIDVGASGALAVVG